MYRTALAVSLITAVASAQEPRSAYDAVRPLIADYLNGDAKALEKMEAAGLASVVLSKAQAEAVEKTILKGNTKVKGRGGQFTVDIEVGGNKTAMQVRVPASYSHANPNPLIIGLHGGGPSDYASAKKWSEDMIAWWFKYSDMAGAILLVPSTWTGWSEESVFAAMKWANENYNIDPNRVMLYGGSMGGFGTSSIAPGRADRFALAAPFIGCMDISKHAGNCRNLPWYIVIGENDAAYNKDGAKASAAELKKLGFDVFFKEMSGKGHEVPPSEYPPLIAKFRKCVRDMHAKKVGRVSGSGPWYWTDGSGEYEAEVSGQTVTITGSGVTRVYLSDKMLNLDQPVKIVVDGQVKHEGKVERSLEFMLKHVVETGDRGRVYSAKVEIR